MSPETYRAWMQARVKHGGYMGGKECPEHYIWRSMIARCHNPKNKDFESYGGRGVRVCKRWQKYEAFISDVGLRPSPEHSLDRKNVDGNYTPSNCRWVTKREQQINKRSTRVYTNGSFTGVLVECAKYLGISKELAHWRWKTHKTFSRGQTWHELQKKP